MPISVGMRQVFNTSVGTVEVLVDRDSDTVSVYRFDAEHRPVAAAMESWRHVDLVDVLNRQAAVPLFEATRSPAQLRDEHITRASFTERMRTRSASAVELPRERRHSRCGSSPSSSTRSSCSRRCSSSSA
jgi:hypothetical protein